ncbi:DUF2806 domain-containing protein [Undibacterium luofuense]|uniref:DUF2806 domain-containing protein n=1 Tax=Undibacterium luofuense TaxID=2828733 RepID=A0A941DQJ4_9BURK|nr:DUF2806 domain-containing protein [Undibacterium luofuense]MBR7783994.1 DUF2806 domain-containing protein [Undibacterium luofuense]
MTLLIKNISKAIGGIFEPVQMQRIAKAEVAVAMIRAEGKIALSEIEERAIERLLRQEARKQEIIEKIVSEALKDLPDHSNPAEIEEDWLAYFFKNCDTVSDNEMQSLWAKMLVGEATSPGTFSKRTIDFVRSVEKEDAHLFTNLCRFVWHLGEPLPLIFDVREQIYSDRGINFNSLKHLETIGLISFELNGLYNECPDQFTTASYWNKKIKIEFLGEKDNKLQIGQVLFSKIGRELFPICGASPDLEFYDYVLQYWKNAAINPNFFADNTHLKEVNEI